MAGAAQALTAPAPAEYTRGQLSMIRRETLGVVGAVTRWNYLLLTASWKLAPTLAMGNTVALKPSEITPLSTLAFFELIADIVPAGAINVVLGRGAVVGAALAQHSDIDMMSSTGSVASGQAVTRDASTSLKQVHLVSSVAPRRGGAAPGLSRRTNAARLCLRWPAQLTPPSLPWRRRGRSCG
jgi:acyl-CoA reductase-like NAD-dependent aldehyde dehydrogenase